MRLPGTFWHTQQLLLLALHEAEDDNNNLNGFIHFLMSKGVLEASLYGRNS
jgi:hypothetical protein